ncbi:MAG: Parallel beta-helix repeat protein [Planctomycetaceae bacterium]|nr:Parallel beta-helix repeat protein [Planctomycetaceae bacterium]
MSLTRVTLCCVVLLAWASYAPVQSQEPATNPGTASLEDGVEVPTPADTPVAAPPPAPAQGDTFYPPFGGGAPYNPPPGGGGYYPPPGGQPGYGPGPTGGTGYVPLNPFAIRMSVRSDIGNGPGWAQGYQSLNGFVPITFEPDRSLLFVNGRAIVTNNNDFVANVGAGGRFYSPEIDRVFGASFWYDYDNSNATNYDQWGISLESLGKYADFRLNAYIPSNDNQSTLGTSRNGNISFIGQNIGIGTNRLVENALRGGDLEVGGAMPFFGDYGLRSYVGAYYFQAPSVESTVGFKYRTEVLVTQDLQMSISASSDKLFGNNLFGAVTYYFPVGGQKRVMSRQPVRERLYTNVERNNRLNVFRRELSENVRAINPETGLAYVVHHVDNINPVGTGDGSVKNPFGSLSDAAPGADIVFVHHNQLDTSGNPILTGLNTGITLIDNERLLGQGTEHLFDDLRYGTLVLPGNDGGPQPIITNPNGDVVTLANNNEVSGLQIGAASPNGPAGNGIFGNGITDFNINNNTFVNAGLAGISINGNGTGNVTFNNFSDSGLANIDISNSTGSALTLDVSGNIAQTGLAGLILRSDGAGSDVDANISTNFFNNNADNGMELSASNSSIMTVVATDNVTNNNGANGFQATADAGTLNLTLTGQSSTLNGGNGLNFASFNGGIFNVDASDNALSTNSLNGLNVNADGGTIDFVNFSNATMNTNTLMGAVFNADNGGIINGTFDSNSLQNNLAGGLSSSLNNGSQLNMAFSQSQFNGNTGFGISLSAQNSSSYGTLVDPVTFSNITVNDNVGPGILVSGTTGSTIGLELANSTISNTVVDATTGLLVPTQTIGLTSNISDGQANITLLSNVFTASQDAGVSLTYSGTTVATQLIDGNTIQDTTDLATTTTPTGEGLIVALAGSAFLDSTITNNTIQNNAGTGILENFNSGNATVTANEVSNNDILLNGGDGLGMQLSFGTHAVLNADHNTITTASNTTVNTTTVDPTTGVSTTVTTVTTIQGANGINLDLTADSSLVANISNNTIDGSSVTVDGVATTGSTATDFSTGSGILMEVRQDATLMATLTANAIRQNGVDGVHVGPDPLQGTPVDTHSSQETSHTFVTLQSNLIEQNRDDGVQVSTNQVSEGPAGFTGNSVYVLNGNTIQNNGTTVTDATTGITTRTGNGINAEVRSGQMDLTITNNTITGNAADGIMMRNSMGYAFDSTLQLVQDVDTNPHSILNATIDGNTITDNGHRGVELRFEDLTAAAAEQGFGAFGNVTLTNNLIDSNRDEGVLVVMNTQHDDNTNFNGWLEFANDVDETTFGQTQNPENLAELNFTTVGNTITNNGGGNPADTAGATAGDGMFILVGTGSLVRADVRNNTFSGNFNDDFRTDSFVAGPQTPLTA